MDVLAAIAVALRVALVLIACAMMLSHRIEIWAVVRRRNGWKRHLSSVVFCALVAGGAVISSVNIFPDAGWAIARDTRLAIVNLGLAIFMIGVLTGLYRRALRAGPEKARAAFLTGFALLLPGAGLVWLLTMSGAHG
ncbi:hypothetical protein [Alteriqipengyuania sp.]|uniref:hypothetical protein n=1 Tax=Alteriqipengyuania sp. TaxID=2800692 RepID=UPI00351807A2